ncbi:MAG: hypothetical protein ACFFDT_20980 [Candidatus Hodarchaeota archaeon]
MPHVVVNGKIVVEDLFTHIKPIFLKTDSEIVKTKDFFLSRNKNAILIEMLAIEQGKHIEFLAMVSQRDDGIVVRISPHKDVEKTTGVKRGLAEIAKQTLALFKDSEVGKTNLTQFLS